MTKQLFEHPELVSDETLALWLEALPEWRRRQALRYKFRMGQVLCAKSYLMLCYGLQRDFGIDAQPAFEILEHGKPVLKGIDGIHFNMSHCHRGILCVIDRQPVGCDIEKFPEQLKDCLIDYCMNPCEKAAIKSSPTPEAEFTRLWTQKEALGKLSGQGIGHNLPTVLDSETMAEIKMETELNLDAGYAYSVCHKR